MHQKRAWEIGSPAAGAGKLGGELVEHMGLSSSVHQGIPSFGTHCMMGGNAEPWLENATTSTIHSALASLHYMK